MLIFNNLEGLKITLGKVKQPTDLAENKQWPDRI